MIFNSDSHFEIGNGHTYCQDYAVHGSLGDYRWGIVCDGCSGSPYTDVGARLIARKADAIIRGHIMRDNHAALDLCLEGNIQLFLDSIMLDICGIGCKNIVKSLSLPDTSLDTTLWVVLCKKIVNDNGEEKYCFYVVGYGDGQVIIQDYSLDISISYVSYQSGAPFYPTYYFNPEREKLYTTNCGTSCKHGLLIYKENKVIQTEQDEFYRIPFFTVLKDVRSVTVASDGFRTYGLKPEQQEDCLRWASTRLVDFKSYEGVFVQRRMKALARKDAKETIGHFDDIAAASVLVVEAEP